MRHPRDVAHRVITGHWPRWSDWYARRYCKECHHYGIP